MNLRAKLAETRPFSPQNSQLTFLTVKQAKSRPFTPKNAVKQQAAQHLHDSTVTTISFKGENDPIEVVFTPNHSQSGEFGSENGSDRFLPQNRIRIGEFGPESSISDQFLPQNSKFSEFGSENGISDQFQQKFTQNHELGPENSISGPESQISGPSPEKHSSGLEPQNSTEFRPENSISGSKTQKFTANCELVPKIRFRGRK